MVGATLVEPDGLATTRGSPPPAAGPVWALAVVIGAVAVGLLLLTGHGIGELSHREIIQAHLDAWYGGDFDTAASLRAPERVRTGPSEERARDEVEYQAILGARAELLECESLPPATVRCDVAYSNALNEAVATRPVIVALQFGIADGLVLFVAGPYLEDEALTASFRDFAATRLPTEYENECIEEPSFQPPDCARLKLRFLEEWADWHRLEAS